MDMATRNTGLGIIAILMWSSLGALGFVSAALDPVSLLAWSFLAAGLVSGGIALVRGDRFEFSVFEFGLTCALMAGYHVAFLEAFKHGPAVPVSILNYLWPMFFVLLGHLFFGFFASKGALIGTMLGFGAAVLLTTSSSETQQSFEQPWLGYSLALFGAVLWALYSNLRRRSAFGGTASTAWICLGAAVICFAAAFVTDANSLLINWGDVWIVAVFALGPAGGAFFLWDYGIRHGDASFPAVAAYATPILSTLLMVSLGIGSANWTIGLAATLVTAGGVLATLKRPPAKGGPSLSPD
ncbi:EamA family transporter [Gymnodinialimonas sp. 2305UL16-5]|uniref:DMT family transporter n=1 Tax=Gymnodinialimonas mytili TaxID=3126503 RepID=UPI0030A25C1B